MLIYIYRYIQKYFYMVSDMTYIFYTLQALAAPTLNFIQWKFLENLSK